MNTILDPEGRIGPIAFRDAALILIGAGALFSMLPRVNPSLALWSLVRLVLVYPWLVIWVKRFHDAGKSGWMFLAVLVLWLIANWSVSHFLLAQFAPVPAANPTSLSEAMAMINARAEATALPSTIVSAVISSVFAFAGNALLKSDPGPNAYDPPPHMR